MIIPRFLLNQDSKTVTIKIRAPFCKLNDLDVSVEDCEFIFYCSPYYLRLNLPGQIEENDRSKSSFDSDLGEFTFQYEKVIPNEIFPDLELITKFICTKVTVDEGDQKIEIITGEKNNDVISNNDVQYGFALRGGYNFNLRDEFLDVFEIDPHQVKLEGRKSMRLLQEKESFSEDHYIADLMETDEINELINLKFPDEALIENDITFNSDELDFLKDLSNVTYTLTDSQKSYCYNGLIDILFAYCYDQRTTYFEETCESGWTISKISATLCWFEGFESPQEAVISAFRRSLIFPLYRNFNLSEQVQKDIKLIVQLGEKYMIKCLIKIYRIFLSGGNQRYILNNLFIKDYIVYIMKWEKESWMKIAECVKCMNVSKEQLGLDLLNIEKSIGNEELNIKMENLNIKCLEVDSDDSEDSSSDSSENDVEEIHKIEEFWKFQREK